MVEFLSDAWFGHASALVGPDDWALGSDANAQLQYTVTGDPGPIHWFQTIGNGRLLAWQRGELADPDVEIQWTINDAADILRERLSGTEAAAVTTIVERRPTGRYVGPPPPMDLASHPQFWDLPSLPGVDLVFQFLVVGGPFGDVEGVISFRDGQVTDMTLGSVAQPDVALEMGFRDLILMSRGEATVLDLLASGQISGFEGSLATLAGLAESPAFRRVLSLCASGHGGLALASLGELRRHPAYRAMLSGLWEVTEPLASDSPTERR